MSNTQSKLQRNDVCHCGSGKKYKKCHMREDQAHRGSVSISQSPINPPATNNHKSFWKMLVGGAVIAALIGVYWGKSLIFAGTWMILYSVARSLMQPPQIKENAGDPAALDFGRRN